MKSVYEDVMTRDPNQPEFHQAVEEVLDSLTPVIKQHPEYLPVVKAMVEAERIIQFRVPWYDRSLQRRLEIPSFCQPINTQISCL